MTLDERLEKARTLRGQGYNCAQCVMTSFPDITGMNDEGALRVSIGFGGGVGGCGEVCGVFSAMAMLEGMRTPGGPTDKKDVYGSIRDLRTLFTDRFGHLLCRDLKAPGHTVSCNDLIFYGIEIYHNHLNNK